MLNKQACVKCFVEQWNEGWTDDDNTTWDEEGTFICPQDIIGGRRSIKDPPPKDCPFLLEQLMSNQC